MKFILSEVMGLFCYIYDTDFRDLEDHHQASAGDELAESVDV